MGFLARKCGVALRSPQSTFVTFVMIVAGVTLFGVGVHFLTDLKMDEERQQLVDQYNGAVEKWKETEFTRFKGTQAWRVKFNIPFLPDNTPGEDGKAIVGTTTESTYLINQTLAPERLTDHGLESLHSYEAVKYESKLTLTENNFMLVKHPWQLVEGEIVFTAVEGEGAGSTFTVPVVFSKENHLGAISWKVCHYTHHGALLGQRGNRKTQTCTVFRQLLSLCLVVEWNQETSQYGWKEDIGCLPRSLEQFNYRTLEVPKYSEAYSFNITMLKVTLRDAYDPWLTAENITHGTLTFGWTHRERMVNGIILCVSALVAVIIALSLVVCCCMECGYYSVDSKYDESISFSDIGQVGKQQSLDIDEVVDSANSRHAASWPSKRSVQNTGRTAQQKNFEMQIIQNPTL
eukprot:TRINITY_DN66334_c5_g7_i1.p1 TRINITY_DN66334_c5_g7~~TRINITY_DN66334_c5_g7_i1.p1  ORF type:complete len:404 (-),score=6.32 TRINITY_DN66334_c5_g7_i1:781-1992(-)